MQCLIEAELTARPNPGRAMLEGGCDVSVDPSGLAGPDPLLTVSVLVDPPGDDLEVEAQQVAPLDERYLPFRDEPAYVTNVHAEALGDRGDVDQVEHGGRAVPSAVPARRLDLSCSPA